MLEPGFNSKEWKKKILEHTNLDEECDGWKCINLDCREIHPAINWESRRFTLLDRYCFMYSYVKNGA